MSANFYVLHRRKLYKFFWHDRPLLFFLKSTGILCVTVLHNTSGENGPLMSAMLDMLWWTFGQKGWMWSALEWLSNGAGSSLRNDKSSMVSTGPRNLETVVLGAVCIQLFLSSYFKSLLLGIRPTYSPAVFIECPWEHRLDFVCAGGVIVCVTALIQLN